MNRACAKLGLGVRSGWGLKRLQDDIGCEQHVRDIVRNIECLYILNHLRKILQEAYFVDNIIEV